ncbi:MAG: hypothetical protein IKX44_01980 [Prevotella sp.]|nr:hypothetical protein [Prevotella sp.]
MRKSLLTLAVFTLGILSANAQNTRSMDGRATRVVPQKVEKVNVAQAPTLFTANQPMASFKVSPSKIVRKNIRKDEAVEVSADYGIPESSYYWGLTSEWRGYSVAILNSSACVKNLFRNYSSYDKEQEVAFEWLLPTSKDPIVMEQDENGNGYDETHWGYYYAPELTVTQGEQTSTYSFGELVEDENYQQGYWYLGTDSICPLSHAASAFNFYGGFSNLDKRFEINSDFDGQKVIGFAEYFDKPASATYVKSIDLAGWLDNCSNIAEPIGENELTAEIYTLDEEGNLSEEPYATAIATFENYQLSNETYGSMGITFVFTEEDELFGTVEKPIILPDQEFMLFIKGMDKIDGNFVAPFCQAFGESGHSYVLLEDGSIATIGYRNYPEIPQLNIAITLNAAMALLEMDDPDQKIKFPEEGGLAYFDAVDEEGNPVKYNNIFLDCNVKLNDKDENEPWQIDEAPEWVTDFALDDEYQEKYWVVEFFMEAEALPEGVEGREGDVVISAYGRPLTIHVTQGKVEEGPSITVDGAAVPVVKTITVNHDEVEKTPYSAKTETFDVAEVVNALGINNISDAAQYIVNVTTNEAVTNTTDGWRNAEGDAAGWGSSAGMVCVKIQNPESGIIDYIGCIDDTHVAGETYTAKWAFVANEKAAVIDVVITFVEKQEQEIIRSLSENVIKARVEYETTEPNYFEKKVELTDDQVNEILADLQLESLAEAEVYGWNPTTEKFDTDFGPTGYDGWRDANGDFHKWTGNATAPACVKYTDGKTYLCYNINGCEEQEIKCYYAIANDKRAVLVEITFAYVVPAGINEINADKKTDAIFNINGVQIVKPQQKGIYIQNGKKVVIK